MPPRFAYWTILIDNTATAFRAQDREDLLPTLAQLQRTNKDVLMKWFARGRLWESPDAAREAARKPKFAEKRDRDWRPGGQHKDPRARFDKRSKDRRPGSRPPYSTPGRSQDRRPWTGNKPAGAPGQRPWHTKPRDHRPWSDRGPKPDRGPKSFHKAFNPRRKPEDPDTKPKT